MPTQVLVIVESGGKIPTLQKYFDLYENGKYLVKASQGHVCDLPPKALGFDPNNNFKACYEITPHQQRTVNELKQATRNHEEVILATDDDREGEAIAQHLCRELGLQDPDRMTFTEITKDAIFKAIQSTTKINKNKVNSQETRRLLDRMIGWIVSPVARDYVVPNSSMGRIQSTVLLYLVGIERAIKNFKSTTHYGVDVVLMEDTNPDSMWTASWNSSLWLKPDEEYWLDKVSATKVSEIKTLKVESVDNGVSEKSPSAPLITSSLQRVAQITLGLTPRQTMELAQKLYEAGAITYMRTDNPNLSADAYKAVSLYAEKHNLPINPEQRRFKTKGSAQEAHEAIRPTSFDVRQVGEGVIQDLYDIIWNRAVASQLRSATYSTRKVVLSSNVEVVIGGVVETRKATFVANGRTLEYDGWLKLTSRDISEKELDERDPEPNNPIPNNLTVDQILRVSSSTCKEKKTTPPKRLTSSALTEKMEALEIGRPSTYASLDTVLLKREFIVIEKTKIRVTDRGMAIIDQMADHFKFIDLSYTAEMEKALDKIANGENWLPITRNFWDEINHEVKAFTDHILLTLPQHKCRHCDSLVLRKENNGSVFWRCRNNQCGTKYSDFNNAPNVEIISKETDHKCLECERNLVLKKGESNGNKYAYFVCQGYSDLVNRCFARYGCLDGELPNFEKYKAESVFRCIEENCNRKLNPHISKKGTDQEFRYWLCSANTRDNTALCHAYYNDLNGEPDFDHYRKSHTHKCRKCDGFLTLFTKKDKTGQYWKCNNIPKGKKKKCDTFYSDKNGVPDFEAYDKNHIHKCFNCGDYLSSFTTKADIPMWRCSNSACNVYVDDLSGEPDVQKANQKYAHKCNKCKTGLLGQFNTKSGLMWFCSADACKVALPDVDGAPDFDFKPSKKNS